MCTFNNSYYDNDLKQFKKKKHQKVFKKKYSECC